MLHSVLLVAILLCVYTGVFSPLGFSSWPWGLNPLWVGLASLWLLWPLVLVLHPGRSLLRVVLPVAVALPFLVFCFFREYRVSAKVTFGLPLIHYQIRVLRP